MYLRFLSWLVGFQFVTGQITLTVPPAGNCGDDTVMTCEFTDTTCTSWGLRKDGVAILSPGTTDFSKYSYTGSVASGTMRFTIKNMEMTDAAPYRCVCAFTKSDEASLAYECKPKNLTQLVTSAKKLTLSVNQVYPKPIQMSVTLNSNPQPGTHSCTGSTSTSYSCTWTSSSSLEDVDGGYRFVVKTVTETPLSGSIKIATPGPPSITNREQLPDSRWVIRGNEDSQVALTCVSSGGIPAPTVAWYRDSISTSPLKSINTGQKQGDGTYRVTLTHSITPHRSDDLRTFVCRTYYQQATSPATQGSRETSVKLYLNLKPTKPVITQTNTPVSTGVVTLECRTSGGRPVPTVTWTYRGQTLSPQVQYDKDVITETYSVVSMLQRQVTVADNGEQVTCHVTHMTMTSERTTNIDVAVKFPVSPDSTVITDNREIIATGSNPLNLNCTTGSSNPASNITWRRGSTVITNSNTVNSWTGTNRGKVTSQILTLRPTRDDDGEVITCSVINSDSDVAASQGEAVTDSVTLNLTYSPEIQPMTGITVDEGQIGVVLPCIVSSKPVSTITWSRGGFSPVQGQGTATGDVFNSFNYTLTTVTRDDQGTYRCRADNQIGTADNKDLVVAVRYVTVTAISTTTDSSSTTVTCTLNNFEGSYESRPWAHKWQQSNGTYVEVSRKPFITRLNLTQLTYEYSGIYTCMVKADVSGAIYVQGNASLLIKAPPVILDPKVNQTRYRVAGRLNHNATVSVQYFSNVPGSNVKCYRSNNGVRSLNTVGIIAHSEMTVQLPVFSHIVPTPGTMATVIIMINREDDFGDYDIVITNGIGPGSTLLISVVSQGPPDAPNSFWIVTYGPDSATLEWVPGYHGGLDQTFVIQLSQNGMAWLNKTSVHGGQDQTLPFSTTLGGLTPFTKYFVRIFAYNTLGQSKGYSSVLNFTTIENLAKATSSEFRCTQGQLVGGMVGTLVFGLLVGVVVTSLIHRYGIPKICVRTSNDNVSDPLYTSKKLKTRQDHYQNTTFSSDTGDSQLTGQAPAVYEDLKTTQRDSNYASLQTASSSEAAYYNLNL